MGRAFLITLIALAVLGAGVWYVYSTPAPLGGTPAYSGAAPTSVYVNSSSNDIVVSAPEPHAQVRQTFTVSGKARGFWYFEASFPIVVIDQLGQVLVETHATAKGDWMTTEFVPFTAQVSIPGNYQGSAKLKLKKDDPSGLSVNEVSFTLPITIQ